MAAYTLCEDPAAQGPVVAWGPRFGGPGSLKRALSCGWACYHQRTPRSSGGMRAHPDQPSTCTHAMPTLSALHTYNMTGWLAACLPGHLVGGLTGTARYSLALQDGWLTNQLID